MLNLKRMVVTLAIVTLAGCNAPPPDPSAFDRQAVEAEISDWVDVFWATWSEGGAGFDRGMALYDDHPDFVFAAEGNIWRSRGATDDAFRQPFENIQTQTFDVQNTAITPLGQDLAYVAQQGTYVQTYLDGTTSGVRTFAFTMLLVRTDAGWRVRFGHDSEPDTE